jgi:hypothetical protein
MATILGSTVPNYRQTGATFLLLHRILARSLKPLDIFAEAKQFSIANAQRLNVGVFI